MTMETGVPGVPPSDAAEGSPPDISGSAPGGWHVTFQYLRGLGVTLTSVLKSLAEKEGTQLSATTRRKLAVRAVEQLNDAKVMLQDSGVELQGLYRWSIGLKDKLAERDKTQSELLAKLEAAAHDAQVIAPIRPSAGREDDVPPTHAVRRGSRSPRGARSARGGGAVF